MKKSSIATSLLACCAGFFLVGCENNSDAPGDGANSTAQFYVSPPAVALESFENTVVLTVNGGSATFIWTVSDASLGIINGLDANSSTDSRSVNYQRVGTAEGANTIRVQDSNGWIAHATVTTGLDGVLIVSPATVTLTGATVTQAFTVQGGMQPYSWSVSDGSLGTITLVSGTTATYTRLVGVTGVNTIHVTDLQGLSAYATVAVIADGGLTLTPSVATLGTNTLSQVFTVQGGTAPYSWSVGNGALGAISLASGTTATYSRQTGVTGANTVSVSDSNGLGATSTIVQN